MTKVETMINDNEAQMKIVFRQDTVSKLSGEGVYKIRNIFNEVYVGTTAPLQIQQLKKLIVVL